jgi:hypothetical protein
LKNPASCPPFVMRDVWCLVQSIIKPLCPAWPLRFRP